MSTPPLDRSSGEGGKERRGKGYLSGKNRGVRGGDLTQGKTSDSTTCRPRGEKGEIIRKKEWGHGFLPGGGEKGTAVLAEKCEESQFSSH